MMMGEEERSVKKLLLLLYSSVKCVGPGSYKNPRCTILSTFPVRARELE